MGTFYGDAKIKIESVKGYTGFVLWIDGVKVKETGTYSLEYTYKAPNKY